MIEFQAAPNDGCPALPCLFDRLSRRVFNKSIKSDDFLTQNGAVAKFPFCNSPFSAGSKVKV